VDCIDDLLWRRARRSLLERTDRESLHRKTEEPSPHHRRTEDKYQSSALLLVFCAACSLVQIIETVPPEILFAHYLYFSSISDAMLSHSQTISPR
jgi:hypothetical protein